MQSSKKWLPLVGAAELFHELDGELNELLGVVVVATGACLLGARAEFTPVVGDRQICRANLHHPEPRHRMRTSANSLP
jgi:hypothetical protein